MLFTRRFFLAALALTSAGVLSACGYRGETVRYRLTVDVDTPQGLRSGSSVLEARIRQSGKNSLLTPEARGVRTDLKGEAVTVEMPDGRLLFALLRRPGGYAGQIVGLFNYVTPLPKFEGEYASVRRVEYLKEHGGAGVVPPERYPMLVTFDDINDPTSIREVDPGDLAASFGEGVSLRSIRVAITDDEVTTGIEKHLKWLPNTHGRLKPLPLDEHPEEGPLPLWARTNDGDFSRGLSD